ncbi:hypothetical protein EPI10_024094 [Gossypium australe]|uniref:Uncharacterized protein n=1 Tax=Gossypium australe TaxID=47621 RepID=A0A5B6VXI4_9ROSI|nr:hypothetical protein EPI10_024094 [Gossypium australe]
MSTLVGFESKVLLILCFPIFYSGKHPRIERMRNGLKTDQIGPREKSTRPGPNSTRPCLIKSLNTTWPRFTRACAMAVSLSLERAISFGKGYLEAKKHIPKPIQTPY